MYGDIDSWDQLMKMLFPIVGLPVQTFHHSRSDSQNFVFFKIVSNWPKITIFAVYGVLGEVRPYFYHLWQSKLSPIDMTTGRKCHLIWWHSQCALINIRSVRSVSCSCKSDPSRQRYYLRRLHYPECYKACTFCPSLFISFYSLNTGCLLNSRFNPLFSRSQMRE